MSRYHAINLKLNLFTSSLHAIQDNALPEIRIFGSGVTMFISVTFRQFYLLGILSINRLAK